MVLAMQGLDSQKPEIVLASGQRLVGKYEGSLGTQVFLELNTVRLFSCCVAAPNPYIHLKGPTRGISTFLL